MAAPNLEHIRPLQEQLNAHPIYGAIRGLADTRVFMSHHVFSVWDFMSLIKYLQRYLAPVQIPWVPECMRPCVTTSTSWCWKRNLTAPRQSAAGSSTEATSSTTARP